MVWPSKHACIDTWICVHHNIYHMMCIYIYLWYKHKRSYKTVFTFSTKGIVWYFLSYSAILLLILFYFLKATFISQPSFENQCLNVLHLIPIFFWRQLQWKQPISASGMGPSKSQHFFCWIPDQVVLKIYVLHLRSSDYAASRLLKL